MSDTTDTRSSLRGQDLTGKRFGRLIVQKNAGRKEFPSGSKRVVWECLCDCGGRLTITSSALTGGNTKSCGCLKMEGIKVRFKTHGQSGHPLHTTWAGMLQRCSNPKNRAYKWYGAKGVKVCERWESFENFLADMLPSWAPGLTLERKDTSKNYEPGNVVWATWDEQHHNRTDSNFITFNGRKQTVVQWATELGMNSNTIYSRLKRGMSAEATLTASVRHAGNRTHVKP